MKIYFDLDGTLAGLYDVPNWLDALRAYDPAPYVQAKALVNLSKLARYLNRLQKMGHELGVVSWLSKNSTPEYDAAVTSAKILWLSKHLPSVKWNEIKIVPYGTNKWELCGEGIIFDDDERVRESWDSAAYEPDNMFEILAELVEMG